MSLGLKVGLGSCGLKITRSAFFIGTLRGVGDYTSLNRPYQVLIICIKAPYPQPPYPPKGPCDFLGLGFRSVWIECMGWVDVSTHACKYV